MIRLILISIALIVATSFFAQAEDNESPAANRGLDRRKLPVLVPTPATGELPADSPGVDRRQAPVQLPAPIYSKHRPSSRPSPARVARLPRNRPPEHATAIVQGDELIVDRFSFSDVEFGDVAEFKDDGEATKELVMRFGTVCQPEATTCVLSFVRAYVGEDEVKPDRLVALLEKPTHVLISPNGKNIDRFYREVFRGDCIVLILPEASAPQRTNTRPDAPIGGNPPGRVQPDYPGFDADEPSFR